MGYYFVKTRDGSVGLYDEDVNDIYHSSCGAYTEAFDKFVIPSQIERFKNSDCNVLDICYGIGYNTRALLKYSLKNNYNINFKIDALELNEDLISLSPFLKIPNTDFYDFEIDKFLLSSYLSQNKFNFLKIKSLISNNKNFLTLYKLDFDKIIKNQGYNYGVLDKINSFLHNIYYHNISISNNLYQISSKLSKSSLKWHINDARKSVLSLNTKYDIIFLDAFTASKQPTLWTKEFLYELISRLNPTSGIIASYSSCSPFRKTLLDLGLYVGKFYNEKINSTIASFDINLLKYKLDSFELGLLYTKAGIPYSDDKLSLSAEEILKIRHEKIHNSNLEATNQYYKRNGKKYGKH